jgi:hypothetical protein
MSKNLESPVAPLTGNRQTMMSWARVIRAYDEIPTAYREAVRPLVEGRSVFPYLVLAPVMSGTRHKDSEKLLCDVDDTFYVVERAGGHLTTTGYPWHTARDIEFGNILLYSWITLSGLTTKGVPAAATVVYNLATQRYFAPFIAKLRPAPAGAGPDSLKAEQAKFDGLAKTSFKFMNFAAESLVLGEQVRQMVWQPEIRQPIASVLGYTFHRTVSQAHFTLLTDQELILIWDDERSVKRASTRYGGVWRYIPLRHLVSATVTAAADGLLTLSLGLTSNGRVDRVFEAARRSELEQLQRAIAALTSQPGSNAGQ